MPRLLHDADPPTRRRILHVVSLAEREDIEASGKLCARPNSIEGKHLWLSLDHARNIREMLIMRR